MRQGNLSCIRLIATIMIISCHILQGLDLEAAFWVNLGVQIFFILSGYLYSRKKITNVKDFYYKQYIKIIAPYLLLCIFVLASNTFNGFKEINKFTTIGDFTSYHHALCGIVLFLIMKNIFKKVKHNKVLELSDKYSYYIYLVHQLFILNDYSFLNKTNSLFLNIIIIIILTLVSAIVLHYITNKINYLIKKINEKNKKDLQLTK